MVLLANTAGKMNHKTTRIASWILADESQTGYDEPLLHTMDVDKPLAGIKAVQTLSHLNHAHPQKHDVCSDFPNKSEAVTGAFADHYRTTALSEEADPNKLNDLMGDLDAHQGYSGRRGSTAWSAPTDGADRAETGPDLRRLRGCLHRPTGRGWPGRFQGRGQGVHAVPMRVIGPLLEDDADFYKPFVQDESFKRFVTDMILRLTGG